jgi:hypothetical protein
LEFQPEYRFKIKVDYVTGGSKQDVDCKQRWVGNICIEAIVLGVKSLHRHKGEET